MAKRKLHQTESQTPDIKTKLRTHKASAAVEEYHSETSNTEETSSLSEPPPTDDEEKLTGCLSSEEEDDDVDWENAMQDFSATASSRIEPVGDLELTLEKHERAPMLTQKKGISLLDRKLRMATHKLHVYFLLFHGFSRNVWLCNDELQAILLSHVPPSVANKVEQYHEDMKRGDKEGQIPKRKQGKRTQVMGKRYQKEKTEAAAAESSGESKLLQLLATLMRFWRKKFTITAPGLRKWGYMPILTVAETIHKAFSEENKYETNRSLGERIENIQKFKEIAQNLEGSRDVGAQLFTALLRALGFDARMVFSLQPLGFGFNEKEEASNLNSQANSDTASTLSTDRAKIKKLKKTVKSNTVSHLSKRRKLSTHTDWVDVASDSEDSEDDGFYVTRFSNKKKKPVVPDQDLQYPIFWTEVFSSHSNTWVVIDPLILKSILSGKDLMSRLEPRGKHAELSRQVICYVVAFSADKSARDVTVRYLKDHSFPGKTKGFRVMPTIYHVYNDKKESIRQYKYDWFQSAMKRYNKPTTQRTEQDDQEDRELKHVLSEKTRSVNAESISAYKSNPDYVLERHIKRYEALKPGAKHVKLLTIGKGDKAKTEIVYRRQDLVTCKSIESWYKEGRVVKEDEVPLKRIKPSAVTLNRKRELETAAAEGDPIFQGLYSYDQTELYNPPPIIDGKIPRNAFGNCDVYVPAMIPRGAVHLPLKGSAKLAKRLGIDYADAVTGFEFKKQRAVPVVEGVVIAAENGELLTDAWRAEQVEKSRKEDNKRETAALALWKKFVIGLRVMKRVREEYGSEDEGDEGTSVDPVLTTKTNSDRTGPNGKEGRSRGNMGKTAQAVLEHNRSGHPQAQTAEGGFFREQEEHAEGGFISKGGDEPEFPGKAVSISESGQDCSSSHDLKLEVPDPDNQLPMQKLRFNGIPGWPGEIRSLSAAAAADAVAKTAADKPRRRDTNQTQTISRKKSVVTVSAKNLEATSGTRRKKKIEHSGAGRDCSEGIGSEMQGIEEDCQEKWETAALRRNPASSKFFPRSPHVAENYSSELGPSELSEFGIDTD